ncbi:hypothetical protein VTL71DRAFT_16328 [Oculimacula yallundae]|uniref:GH16 domain-containing protein n=1 Tax=Oculimacula yallundae TaxID=86028 RepID=A0ABR4CER0_9HELO
MHSRTLFGFFSWAVFFCSVQGICECGFSVNTATSSSNSTQVTYANTIESDFTEIQSDRSDRDWFVLTWNQTTGYLNKIAEAHNVVYNHALVNDSETSRGINGGDPGVELIVRSTVKDGFVSLGEIRTIRKDIMYGSFRASVKFTGINGTCGAFFWYYNATQEIDIEARSSQINTTDNISNVNLVLHSQESLEAGSDAANTSTFETLPLKFLSYEGFHEYRMDWIPGAVTFFIDGKYVFQMNTNIPTVGGRLTFNHWSNGNPGWSGGPPLTDATMTVKYMKAYFNSSIPHVMGNFTKGCTDPTAEKAICKIDDDPAFWITKNGTVAGAGTPPYGPRSSSKRSDVGRTKMSAWCAVSLVVQFFFV